METPCTPWPKLFLAALMIIAFVNSTHAADNAPLPHIDSKRAFQYTREVTAFGPRYIGSENHKKLERYILDHLKGDQVEDDAFTADTPEGKFPIRNILAKFPGTKDGIIVIFGHYDTNYPLRNTGYVGANDGGSSTAILLEYANQFARLTQQEARRLQRLARLDRRRGSRQDLDRHRQRLRRSPSRGKVGKRRHAEKNQGPHGHGHDRRRRPQYRPQYQWRRVAPRPDLCCCRHQGYQSHFYAREGAIEDDHIPFLKRGVPTADVIDLDYGYNNVFHHTPQDTMDKLSPKSLQIVGDTILETIRMLDQR